MKNNIELTADNIELETTPSLAKRASVLLYGILSYAVGCFGLFWLLLGAGGIVPVSISSWSSDTVINAILVNVALILMFGIPHSVMARQGFKNWIKQYIPEAAERSTYMLVSGVLAIIGVVFWQEIPGTVWQVENGIGQVVLWALYGFGLVYLLLATFVTNHFELMGLRQVYLYFTNKPYKALPFTNKYMYRYSRHPMMLGMLLIFWATPVMSVTHAVLATLFTSYLAIGIFLEERDLVRNFGETYRKYKKSIAMFIPKVF
ncbi:MAG: NnrU family protein [Gammaproteobacteria bacterium]|nr:NnrU family protein [Gammaproteobacteria bacterium]MDH5694887.1 NnrU family protein [Gammaproteobacteria bacterium]